MKNTFSLVGTGDDGDKYYHTKDRQFTVIERKSGTFLLFALNKETDVYHWTGTNVENLEDCEKEMKKIKERLQNHV